MEFTPGGEFLYSCVSKGGPTVVGGLCPCAENVRMENIKEKKKKNDRRRRDI